MRHKKQNWKSSFCSEFAKLQLFSPLKEYTKSATFILNKEPIEENGADDFFSKGKV